MSNFTTYAFKADSTQSGQVTRNMPVRLSDVVNVKDWGALGNGTTDDTLAIKAAIAFAGSTTVWFPPGTYAIGNPGGVPTRLHLAGNIVGSGRDVTILTGDFSTGDPNPAHFDAGAQGWLANNPMFLCWSDQNQILLLADLTIRNTSTVGGSGAYFTCGGGPGYNPLIRNCRFIGTCGVHAWLGQFGIDIHSCVFTSSIPPTTADNNSRKPTFTGFGAGQAISGSVGCYVAMGSVFNCRAENFDVGFAFANNGGPFFAGNTAYRCYYPFYVGGLNKDADQEAQQMSGGVICSNVADRCLNHFNLGKLSEMGVVGNVLAAGEEGPYDRSVITNLTYSGGLVTGLFANTVISTSIRIRLFVTPSGWTPDSTGIVTVTINTGDFIHFTYPLAVAPGAAFVSGEWNWVQDAALSGANASQLFLAANTSATPFDTRITMPVFSGSETNNVAMAMRSQGAFYIPGPSENPGAWEVIMCGKGGSNAPVPKMTFASLPNIGGGESTAPQGPFDGQTFNIVDGSGAGTFGSTVGGSGSGRWKVRYNGTNWTRIG